MRILVQMDYDVIMAYHHTKRVTWYLLMSHRFRNWFEADINKPSTFLFPWLFPLPTAVQSPSFVSASCFCSAEVQICFRSNSSSGDTDSMKGISCHCICQSFTININKHVWSISDWANMELSVPMLRIYSHSMIYRIACSYCWMDLTGQLESDSDILARSD